MDYMSRQTFLHFLVILVSVTAPSRRGDTSFSDVAALNSLYVALGNPPLIGWLPIGGDPCGLAWQGVECVNTNVTGIDLNGVDLGGQLSNDLGSLSSIIFIDMSNNHIGGSIPSSLPPTIRTLSLSDNQLTGNIPDAISSLGQLEDLNLQNNHLNGPIPDAFQQLFLVNFGKTSAAYRLVYFRNLSGNTLNGQLPPSMGNLTSLTRLGKESEWTKKQVVPLHMNPRTIG